MAVPIVRPVPYQRRFALVGNADGFDRVRAARGLYGRAADLKRRLPDVFRIVLDPSVLRENLPERFLRGGDGAAPGVEHHGARRGRALVDGKDERSGHGWRLNQRNGFRRPR
jgi:hypothetical protein